MTEQGVVVKDGELASVKIDKKDECSKCGLCLFPKNASSIEVPVENKLGAVKGDKVIIERTAEPKLLGIFLAFVVPLLLIGVSALLTYLVIKVEYWLAILSVGLVVIWYALLALFDKKLKTLKKYSARITEIIKENKENESDN